MSWGSSFIPAGAEPGRVGWPSLLVELNPAGKLTSPAGPVGGQPPGWGIDLLPAALAARGLLPVGGWRTPPRAATPRWTVQLSRRARRPAGVYGPGAGDVPGGWALMSPLPAGVPPLWKALPAHTGGQCAVYVSTTTDGLVHLTDIRWEQQMDALAAAGLLFGARAAVIT